MKIQIPDPGDVAAFQYDSQNPTKYTEQLSHYLLTKYKAMAEAKMVLDDGQVDPESEEGMVVESIWNAQSELIKQQQERFRKIENLLKEKKEALPEDNAITALVDSFIESAVESFTAWIVAKLAASAVGSMAGGVVIPLTVVAIATLRETYFNGETLVKGIINMMESLVGGGLPKTKENYEMRSRLIDQNEKQLANYLNEMVQIEQAVRGGGNTTQSALSGDVFEEMNEHLERIALAEKMVLCPHTGQCISGKSLHKLTP